MRTSILGCVLLMLGACGGSSSGNGDDGGIAVDADPNAPDADPNAPDARVPAGCDPNGAQCNNCIDDDDDGLIDGFDPECTGPADDREDSFATGIPGDNIDDVFQDCFFDGNSGHEDDGCQIPTCCLTEGDTATCPPATAPPTLTCQPTQECVNNCAPLTPPGCDCFGCCTICNDDGCYDIATGLAGSDCNSTTLSDSNVCPTCVKTENCGGDCDPANCVLCPGQTQDDLPPECDEQVCPGTTTCGSNADCGSNMFCSNGCCIHVVD